MAGKQTCPGNTSPLGQGSSFRHATGSGRGFLAFAHIEKTAVLGFFIGTAIGGTNALVARRASGALLASAFVAFFPAGGHTASGLLLVAFLAKAQTTGFAFFFLAAAGNADINCPGRTFVVGTNPAAAVGNRLRIFTACLGLVFAAFFQSEKSARFASLDRRAIRRAFIDAPRITTARRTVAVAFFRRRRQRIRFRHATSVLGVITAGKQVEKSAFVTIFFLDAGIRTLVFVSFGTGR